MTISKTRDRHNLLVVLTTTLGTSFPHTFIPMSKISWRRSVVGAFYIAGTTLMHHTFLHPCTASFHSLPPSPLKPPTTPLSSRPPSSPSKAYTPQNTTSRRSARNRSSHNHPLSGSSQSTSQPGSRCLCRLRSHCTRCRTRHI